MKTLRFRTLMKIHGVNPYVLVSAKRASELKPGWRKPMPVLVRINGKPKEPIRPHRSAQSLRAINMMPVGDGSFRLYLNGKIRKASNTSVGDRVEAEVRFDAKYKSGPAHPMPAWFWAALRENRKARKNWGTLIPSRKKEILRFFAVEVCRGRRAKPRPGAPALSGKPERFMALSWSRGK